MSDAIRSLLTHDAWLRRLAARLVADPAAAADAVQDTWLTALRHPPAHHTNPRGWLAAVLRGVLHTTRRGADRRTVHERAAARGPTVAATGDVVARVEEQRRLAGLVLELDARYRDCVVLRWFEDLPPREVAARLGVPVETVRTRLRRATAMLRARLDGHHGSRAAWALPWLDLFGDDPVFRAGLGTAGEATSDSVPTALDQIARWLRPTEWTLMKPLTKLAIAATVLLTAGTTAVLVVRDDSRPHAAPPELGNAAGDVATERSDAPARPLASAAPDATAGADRAATSSAIGTPVDPALDLSAGPVRLVGRVVDPSGRPLPGLRVHWSGPLRLRWSDSIDPWINSAGGSLRVDAELRARLANDPTFAETTFAGFEDPSEWRAFLLGEVTAGRGVRAGPDGRFGFDLVGDAPRAGRLTIVEPGFVTLARGARNRDDGSVLERVLVAAPAIDVGGRVVDNAASPIADVIVSIGHDPGRALPRLDGVTWPDPPLERGFRTGPDGRFLLRSVPVLDGAMLEAVHDHRGRAVAAMPTLSTDGLVLVLDRVPLVPATVRIAGRVVAADGTPVSGAQLLFASVQSQSDAAGEFSMELPTDRLGRALHAVAVGHGAVSLEDFGARLFETASRAVPIVVRLGPPPLAITGRLVDPTGSPLAGVSVNLFDPTLPDTTYSSLEMMSEGRRDVTTDAAGRFRIGGLTDREYRLRIWRLADRIVHVTGPLPAGISVGDLEVPVGDIVAVRGRVVDGAGRPVEDVAVRVGWTTFQPRHGWLGELSDPVATDGDGRFTLPHVPPRHVFLEMRGDAIATRRFPIEDVVVISPAELRVDRLATVTAVALPGHSGDALTFLDIEDRPVDVAILGSADETTPTVHRHPTRGYPACRVPESARTLAVLVAGTVVSRQRVELAADRATRIELH